MIERENTSIQTEKRNLSPKTTVIFDFDGTMADSRNTVRCILNEFAKKYHYPKLGESDFSFYNKSAKDFIREDLRIHWWQLPRFAKKINTELSKRPDGLKPIGGILDVVRELKSRGYAMGIVSSNLEINVRQFLANNDLDIFDAVSSGNSTFGKGKKIKKVLRQMKTRPEDVVYVGDEIRDADAARKVGIDIVLVSWGYNSRKALDRNNSGILVDSPSQLLDLLPPKKIL